MDAEILKFDPTPGLPEDLGHGVRRVLAPNPSPMTFRGTNTYLVGQGDIAVIDPGPDDPAHLQAILAVLRPGEWISHILVTHAHLDHSPLARPLADHTGAPILAFGDAFSGRSAVMQDLAERGLAGGGEGVDAGFTPDQRLAHGDRVQVGDVTLTALHTPGHFGNHLAFAMGDICFTGDLVMGWASSLVSPPDGDLTDFMASCRMLRDGDWTVFHAGHGAPIETPLDRLDWLIAHRETREAEILAALADGPARAFDLATRIYTETPPALIGAATRNVFAHLVDLTGRKLTAPEQTLESDAVFRRL
ncbi:MBL fold metallo-hydrolase [Shimia biformata]|uniref:MBL fold metallo-hydrolase n=1 Tax=Shimia biformata TaxID=1294299 RepID=UPI001951C556|nr:MBL fold metallo-hydrolase [Shimia biformata]